MVVKATRGDFILCQLTSQSSHGDGIEVDPQSDVPGGSLRGTSYARQLKLFTANQRIIKGVIGALTEEKFNQVVEQIVTAIEARFST